MLRSLSSEQTRLLGLVLAGVLVPIPTGLATARYLLATLYLRVSPTLAVGVGASVSAQAGKSKSLGIFFGNNAAVAVSWGIVGGTLSGNESGASVSGGLSLGAKVKGESSYAMPLGNPFPTDC